MLNKNQEKAVKMLASGCFRQKEIAEALNVTEQTVVNWKKNPEFMEAYHKEININLKYLSHKALTTMNELLKSDSEKIRFSAAKDILDRTGFKQTERIEVDGSILNPFAGLTTDELKKLINSE